MTLARLNTGMHAITYAGRIVAFTGATRFHFTPELDDKPPEDPLRRFVSLMCAYAQDVDAGELPGPYSDQLAEVYARSALIDDDEFRRLAPTLDDAALAQHFNVPVEQIAHKRADPLSPADPHQQTTNETPEGDRTR